jgi:rhomboid protease GluP
MLGILGAIYLLEITQPVGGDSIALLPTTDTLVAFGALVRDLVVERGEWYRILTGPLLHASPMHILFNGLAFWYAAGALERLVGRIWLFVLFFLGAVGGAALSMLINPPEQASVGASGAIMCLIAAAWIALFRANHSTRREQQGQMLRMLVPSLLPLAIGHIDYAAHFGGAFTGAILGGFLWFNWEEERPSPRLNVPARVLAAMGLVFFADAGIRAQGLHAAYGRTAGLIPDADMPSLSDADHYLPYLLAKYPDDPRTHWLWAEVLMPKDKAGAERELRVALAKVETDVRFMPGLKREITEELVEVLFAEGRIDDALKLANPMCADGNLPFDIRSLVCKPN